MLGPCDLEECFDVMDQHHAERRGHSAGQERPLAQRFAQASMMISTLPVAGPALLAGVVLRRSMGGTGRD